MPPARRTPDDRRPTSRPRPQRHGEGRSAAERAAGGTADRDGPRRADRDGPRRPRVVEPELPDDVDPRELDRVSRAGLRSLPTDLADRIARHLVMAGRLVEDDPQAAAAHAQYARHLAPRLAVVREATGVAAYRCGDYATALTELRAARRMTGDPSYLPIMADSERGLGRPERTLALASEPDARRLRPAERVELAIVVSGARRDRGEARAAVVALQGPDLDRPDVQPWTVRLWYAYAAALADAGRIDEAKQWFESVVTIDEDDETDAQLRLAELADGASTAGS